MADEHYVVIGVVDDSNELEADMNKFHSEGYEFRAFTSTVYPETRGKQPQLLLFAVMEKRD